MNELNLMKIIKERDTNWDKRLGSKAGDLFWADENHFKIITQDGVRSAFTIKEILEIEIKLHSQ